VYEYEVQTICVLHDVERLTGRLRLRRKLKEVENGKTVVCGSAAMGSQAIQTPRTEQDAAR